MKEKFREFMRGRYGPDQLSRDTSNLAIILLILNLFVKAKWIHVLIFVLLMVSLWRMLSKNFKNRYNENRIYLNMLLKFKNKFTNLRHYKQFKCPNCKQKLRVPRGKKKITVTCPKCRHQFDKRS